VTGRGASTPSRHTAKFTPAAVVGEHTRQILSELGMAGEGIDDLLQRGIVGGPEAPAVVPSGGASS